LGWSGTYVNWTFKSIASYLKFRSVIPLPQSIIQLLNPYFVLHQSSVLTLISTALHQDFTAFVVMLAVLHEIRHLWSLWDVLMPWGIVMWWRILLCRCSFVSFEVVFWCWIL